MTDKDVINYCFKPSNKLKSNVKQIINNNNELRTYLNNRYTDMFNSDYKIILKRILNHIETPTTCDCCNKLFLNFNNIIFDTDNQHFNFCSITCHDKYLKNNFGIKKKIIYKHSETERQEMYKKRSEMLQKRKKENPEWQTKVNKKRLATIQQKELENPGYIHNSRMKGVETLKQKITNDPYGIQKRTQTCQKLYGDNYLSKFAKIAAQTTKERYGKYTTQFDSMKQASKNTKQIRYGDSNYNNREKAKQTCQELYGGNAPACSKEVQEKMQQSCLEKYGTKNVYQSMYFHYNKFNKYMYNNETFDSSWELAYYIWNKDQNNDIKRNHCSFTYNYNNEIHYYFPDFVVNGQLIEIKGDHFFKNEKMINPFDRSQDGLYEAKHQCALQNNVQIIRSDKIIPIIEYIESTYGKNYLDKWKINK